MYPRLFPRVIFFIQKAVFASNSSPATVKPAEVPRQAGGNSVSRKMLSTACFRTGETRQICSDTVSNLLCESRCCEPGERVVLTNPQVQHGDS